VRSDSNSQLSAYSLICSSSNALEKFILNFRTVLFDIQNRHLDRETLLGHDIVKLI
jgi:hypothetical protein